jgi:hypothetical protein
LDKCFLGPLKSHFKKEGAASKKQTESVKETARYHMARFIGFAWNKAASVGVDVSAFKSTSIYPLNRNRMPNYFPISDTS